MSPCLAKFYGSRNSILSVLGSKHNEMLSVFMVRQCCLPSMMYGSEIRYTTDNKLRPLDIAWNNAFRKIFNGFWRDSVKPRLFYCKCLPLTFQANLNKLLFWKKLMVFTALHGMQTRSCDENSVRLSVCLSVLPSVRQMREL